MIEFEITTSESIEMIDISRQVRQAIADSGVEAGLCTAFTPHTTAAITINENADPDVVRDLLMELNKIVPLHDGYRHAEGNSAAHLKSSLVGASETLIIEKGQPQLGIWQGIYFCEFDGPRSRRVQLQIIGQ